MADRRELFKIARELKRWLQWQGSDDDMGVLPASKEKREALRERVRERRSARAEQLQSQLESGVPDPSPPEAEAPAEPEPASENDDEQEEEVWRELGSQRTGAPAGDDAGASADGGPTESSGDDAPATNAEKLQWLRDYMGDCRRCPLWENRQNLVFGEGDPEARLVFVGEAPGKREDRTGRPFVGPAGELLNDMIAGMGLERDDTYICNVLKSRPPDNRDPRPDEIRECFPFLRKQLEIIEPEAIVTLGRPATQNLLDSEQPLGALRARWHDWEGIPVMPTYHPAYLLRNPEQKRKVWSDLQQVIDRLDLPGPG